SATELRYRRFPITPLQVGQEQRPFLRGSRLPHDLPSVPRLVLARRLAGGPIREPILRRNGSRVGAVRIQGMNQRRSPLNHPNPPVAVAVNPPLRTLGQAEPALQIEIVPDRLELSLTPESPGPEADPHTGHLLTDRIRTGLEPIDPLLE